MSPEADIYKSLFDEPEPERAERFTGDANLPPFHSIADLFEGAASSATEWLWAGIIPIGEVTILAGDGGVGKGLLVSQLAAAVAAGRPLFGLPVQLGTVIIVNAEDTAADIYRPISAVIAAQNIPSSACNSILAHSLKDVDNPSLFADGKPTPVLQNIERAIIHARPKLLVLDPAADLYGGIPVDAQAVNAFMRRLAILAQRWSLAVVLVAHVSVSGNADGSGRSGLVNWNNKARARLYLKQSNAKDGRSDPNVRVLTQMKNNRGPSGRTWNLRWSEGRFIECEIAAPKAEKARFNKAERISLAALESVTNSDCHAHFDEWRKALYEMMPDDIDSNRRQAFNRSKNSLQKQGLISIDDKNVTVTDRDIFTICHAVTVGGRERDIVTAPFKGGVSRVTPSHPPGKTRFKISKNKAGIKRLAKTAR